MNRKFIVSFLLLLTTCGLIFFLWKQPVLLSILLLLSAYIKYRLYPIKHELLWFSIICIGGAFIEGLLVNISGAWTYASPQLFNIPIWMPIFWGTVGTIIIVLHEGLIEQLKRKS